MAHPSFQSLKILPAKLNNQKHQRFVRALTWMSLGLLVAHLGRAAFIKSDSEIILHSCGLLFLALSMDEEQKYRWAFGLIGMLCFIAKFE
ncbi:hypothetical protein B1R32_11550 [Abditibacterium utsteinense]|uniref:Uncharacterized protein n=1 Tax=Abditibacterium utsteinense TaxID=1960156 RepID=A0A2S8SQR8_9BACT|nr:hypothetical protein [Abditibacterium utsteinense]PQV63143.1 hypothetical protein B1R32_11550 [Abditibacterium utsteinense]